MITVKQKTPLPHWIKANTPEFKMMWRSSAEEQFALVSALEDIVDYYNLKGTISVVSTHRSKSILLPVVLIDLTFAQIVLRGNFENWRVSVLSWFELPEYIGKIFVETEPLFDLICEGFHPEWIFGLFKNDRRKFSISLNTDLQVTAFLARLFGFLETKEPT